MKRGIVLSFLAVMVAVMAANAALATTDIALNLRYADPAAPAEGGQWQLVAATDDANGLAGVSAYLTGISSVQFGGTVFTDSAWTTSAIADEILSDNDFGSVWNITWGFDLDGTDTAGIGYAGYAGNQAQDPLDQQNAGAGTWDDVAILATGTFGATRPAFVDDLPNTGDTTEANVHTTASLAGTGVAAADTIGLLTVRGDAEVSLGVEATGTGLLSGDANRDGIVNFLDFSALSGNFGLNSSSPEPDWAQGNFNDDNDVNFLDFSALSGNFGSTQTPPPVGAVPEPTSLVLMAAGLALAGLRRHN